MPPVKKAIFLLLFALLAAAGCAQAADTRPLRVAVIGNSPPMSYVDANGKLSGFNVAFARALCDTIKASCEWRTMPLNSVLDNLASGEVDFAVVSLLVTPERQQKVLFTKPYYRSLTVWLGKAGHKPGDSRSTTAVVAGSVQAKYALAQGWKVFQVNTHAELPQALLQERANAVLVPMLTAIPLMQDKSTVSLGLESTMLHDPALTGEVAVSVNPRLSDLRDRLDNAIDQIKRDGRFDRMSSDHLPFKLQ